MKKIMYAVMLLLAWGIPFISCNGSENQANGIVANREVSPQKTATVLPEGACKSVLNRLYNDYVFGNKFDQFDQVVDELFTAKAKQKLIDAYDYDCEGVCYAIWEFRTVAQDGDGDSRLEKINYSGGNIFEVHYIDMGWKGTTFFLFVSDNGKVKIDDFIRDYDESRREFGSVVDKMDVVVDDQGQVEGAYLLTDGDNYFAVLQDYFTVPIAGHRIVTFSAENGQGVVYTDRSKVNVRKAPSTSSTVVTQMPTYEEGMMPETFPCLGKEDGWYKIRINGKEGYVREDLVEWLFCDF